MIDRILNLPDSVRATLFVLIVVAVGTLGWFTLRPTPEPATPNTTTSPVPTSRPNVINQPVEGDDQPQDNPTVGNYTKDVTLDLDMPVSKTDLENAASRAVHFSQLYLSYAYDQNNHDKTNEIERLLGKDNAVDLTKVFPSGPTQKEFTNTQTRIAVKVNKVAVDYISPQMLGLTITATTTTTTVSDQPQQSQHSYALTLTRDVDRADWYVAAFTANGEGSEFQDETSG